jgi:hypothetical protein
LREPPFLGVGLGEYWPIDKTRGLFDLLLRLLLFFLVNHPDTLLNIEEEGITNTSLLGTLLRLVRVRLLLALRDLEEGIYILDKHFIYDTYIIISKLVITNSIFVSNKIYRVYKNEYYIQIIITIYTTRKSKIYRHSAIKFFNQSFSNQWYFLYYREYHNLYAK